MNPSYDLKEAASRLEELAGERSKNSLAGIQLSRCTKTPDWPSAYKIMQTNLLWRLIFAGKEVNSLAASEIDEAIIHIQGIIWRHDLPPFQNQSVRTKYLRQSVSLTGLGTPTFETAMKGVLDIYALFSGYVSHNKLKSCSTCDNYGEHSSFESSNRYFTTTKDAPASDKQMPFTSEVDPHGILSGLANYVYLHCESNVVQYFERKVSPTGEARYTHIPPVRFQVGDIVEAQVSLMLVPIRGDQYQMVSVLRGLTLLDNSFTQKAFAAQAASAVLLIKTPAQVTVKRKVGYAEEEHASKRGRTNEMDIDGENTNGNEI
ncbi:hypothetical protein JOM56_010309 [Amanita muscaria]